MAVGTIDGTTYTAPTDTGIMANLISGLKAPMLGENEVLDPSGAFWAAVEYGLIGAGIGGIVGRRRSEAGKEKMLGIFF